MTIARWPRLSRATVTPRPTAVPADQKPWLHRRSVRNAPAPTALRVEPWDSEILRTLTDNACRDCGYAKCACPENAIAKDGPPPFVAPGKPQHATFDRECFGPDPAPKAGEREVRVGDVWRYDETGHCYRITDAVAVIGDCVASPNGQWPRPGNAGCHLTIGAPGDRWTLLSRTQPAAVDDGAVRIGDSYVLHETPEPWTVTRFDGAIAWGARPGDRETNVSLATLRRMVDTFGKPITRIARGPVPT